jgi:hypothetical protein
MRLKYAFAPVTVSAPRKCDGPSRAEHDPINTSFSDTPGVPWLKVGDVVPMRRPDNRQSPKADFQVTILILRPVEREAKCSRIVFSIGPGAQDVNEPEAGRSVEVRGNQTRIFTVKK